MLNSLLDEHHSKKATSHYIATCHLISKQCSNFKNPIVDTNNCLNKIFSAFNSLNKELSPSFYLVDTFSDHFSFHLVNCKDTDIRIAYYNNLKNIYENPHNNHEFILIITNVSIKNNIATSVSHIWREHKIIVKTIHHAINVLSTKAKMFAIRCGISHASQLQVITCIVVITDAIYTAKHIFDMFICLYQLHSITISNNLRKLFDKNTCNSIWQMYFQASDYKKKHFLDLYDDDNQPIHSIYSKGSM